MSWRSRLEDQYTVKCRVCGHESVDPRRKPGQKYAKGRCPNCNAVDGKQVIMAECHSDDRNVEALLDALNELLDRVAEQGLTAEQLAHAQELLVGSYALDLQRVADRNRLAARGLFVQGVLPAFESYERAIRAVTTQQVRDLAEDLFDADNGVTIVVLPEGAGATDEAEVD